MGEGEPAPRWSSAAAAAAALGLSAAALYATFARRPAASAGCPEVHSSSSATDAHRGSAADPPLAVAPAAEVALAAGAAAAALLFGKGGQTALPHVVDVTALPESAIPLLREAAGGLHAADGTPATQGGQRGGLRCEQSIKVGAEYCGWYGELLSPWLFKGFLHERNIWMLALEVFKRHIVPVTRNGAGPEQGALLLDVGANIGDWVAPLALSRTPGLHVAGVEALPANAALAAHNLRTALREVSLGDAAAPSLGIAPVMHQRRPGEPPARPGGAYIVPYALLGSSEIAGARAAGGVCLGVPSPRACKVARKLCNMGIWEVQGGAGGRGRRRGRSSGGGSSGGPGPLKCPPGSAAGATTLDATLAALPHNLGRRVLAAKIDVQGSELKLLLGGQKLFAETPPCYLFFEYEQCSTHAVAALELLLGITGGFYTHLWSLRGKRAQNSAGGTEQDCKNCEPTGKKSRCSWARPSNMRGRQLIPILQWLAPRVQLNHTSLACCIGGRGASWGHIDFLATPDPLGPAMQRCLRRVAGGAAADAQAAGAAAARAAAEAAAAEAGDTEAPTGAAQAVQTEPDIDPEP